MDTIEFRAQCPNCQTVRPLIGPASARTPAELDAFELALPKIIRARCPQCDRVELVAMFVDGARVEPWQDADEAQQLNGPDAGPLLRKPWPDTN